MKKVLLLLAVLMCRVISLASISYTAQLDPTLLNIITEEKDSLKSSVLYYPNSVSRFVDNEPVYPIINYTFSVPYNAVGFTVESNFIGASDINLQAPLAVYVEEDSTFQNGEKDQSLKSTDAVISQNGYLYGTNQVVTVSINPFVYNGKDLSMYTQVQLTINWQIASDEKELGMEPTYNSKARINSFEDTKKYVVNPEAVEENAPSIAIPLTTDQEDYDYIIIAVDKLCNAAQRLAAMRRVMGYGARVFNLSYALSQFPNGDSDGFKDDAGRLKEFIKYCYRMYGTRNVLLLGKYPEMPIRLFYETSSDEKYQDPTDFYFAEFNSKWERTYDGKATLKGITAEYLDIFPEINIGRIPAETVEDVNNYINKLKIYEWNPGNGNYYYLSRGFLARQVDDYIDKFTSVYTLPFYKLFEEGGLCQLISQPSLKGSEVVEALNGAPSVIHNFLGHGHPGGVAVGTNSSGVTNGLLALENTSDDPKYDWFFNHESKNGLNNLTNKYYPGWTYSMSCSLMPFDIFVDRKENTIYDVTRNFGESYILGKDYGGVAMMGNTRPCFINAHRGFIKKVFEKVWETYKDKSADPYEKLYASTMRNEIWQLSYNPLSGAIYEKIKHNLLGDPLTELRFGEPIQFTINEQSNNSNVYSIGMSGPINTDYYIYATVPLIDATYASWEENDVRVEKAIELTPNEIQVLTAKNAIPKILPLHIQNFIFDGSTTPYIFADQVYIEKANPYDKEDKVLFSSTADVTIESLSNVFVDDGTVFESGSKLTINAAGEANLCRITIPAGATLIVNAQRIVYGEDLVTFHPNSTVILNGKKITNSSSKSVARRSDYDPLVKEGKTFWYYNRNQYRYEDNWITELGIRIGGTVNVEGEEWHKVNIIREVVQDVYGNVKSVCDDPKTIQYIREEDMKVRTINCPNDSQHLPWYKRDPFMSLDHFFFASEGYWYIEDIHNVTFDLYDFTPGAEEYTFGSEYSNYIMALKDEESRENSGIERRVKTYAKKAFESSILEEPASAIFRNQEFQLIEGIGVRLVKSTLNEECNMNELFFAPFCCFQMAVSPMPNGYFLRYVTDENDNIVYEGRGGITAWTIDPSGVESVISQCNDDVEWYTLSGMKVSAPGEHGIYIRKRGSDAEKVRF